MPVNRINNKSRVDGQITDDDIYLMVMLYKYQRKTCDQLARQFGLTRAQVFELLARRQIGGCCG